MQNKPWLKNYDQGVPHSIEYPAIPLFGLLEESAKKYPERVCTIFKGAETSYKEMDDYANRLAAAFHGLGIKKGDRVGLFMPNTPQFVMAYYGLLKAGAVVVATNPLYTEREIIYQVNDAGVEHMVLMTNNYEKVKAIQDQTRIKQIIVTNLKEALPPVTRILFTLLKEKKSGFRVTLRDNDVWMPDLLEKYSAEDRPELDITPQDTALFQYSGGTTGISKGVVESHEAVVANSCQIASWNPTAIEGAEIICMA
ncbi:MAG: AMP-binding protein, partial [Chloroflexi bacterium]|nr:AMP-binding protein [Chloroflexota bacterium]